jgi:uncharacterized protein (TIGR00251 family)
VNEDLRALLADGKDGVYLNIHAQPGAKRMQLRGLHGDAVKIAVQAVAQDGKANRAIVGFVAEALDLPANRVTLASGQTSRRKRLFLAGDAEDLRARVAGWLADAH